MSTPSPFRASSALSEFGTLRERARELLSAAPDGLDDAEMAAGLFGAPVQGQASLGASWSALLPGILKGERSIERVDGRWRLTGCLFQSSASSGAPAPILVESTSDSALAADGRLRTSDAEASEVTDADDVIVTLALATTGADPRRHRVVRLALVALEADGTLARVDAAIAPDDSSRSHRHSVGLGSQLGHADTQTWSDLMLGVNALVLGRVVYAYGAARLLAFLQAELRRADLPPCGLRLAEADTLLRGLLPNDHKPGPVAAARELGVPYREPGVPLADAEVLARVIRRLRDRQAASPSRAVVVEAVSDTARSQPLPFTHEWLSRVPDSPGIYVFRGATGHALYVGKAASLVRRLSDYVRRQPGAHRQLDALAVRTTDTWIRPVPSDVEASLLEARLIRELQPEFNVARNARTAQAVIKADPDAPSPRVQLVPEALADGARYFGPFESGSAARKALDVARSVYPNAFLRARADVTAQRLAVLDVCRLLSGQKAATLTTLREQMRFAADRGAASEIDRLRQALRDVQGLDLQPSILAGLQPDATLLCLEHTPVGVTRLHLIQHGKLLASASWDVSYLPTDDHTLLALATDLHAAREERLTDAMSQAADDPDDSVDVSVPPQPFHPDDCALVLRWLVLARGRIEVARVPTPDPVQEA